MDCVSKMYIALFEEVRNHARVIMISSDYVKNVWKRRAVCSDTLCPDRKEGKDSVTKLCH